MSARILPFVRRPECSRSRTATAEEWATKNRLSATGPKVTQLDRSAPKLAFRSSLRVCTCIRVGTGSGLGEHSLMNSIQAHSFSVRVGISLRGFAGGCCCTVIFQRYP